MRDLSVQPKWCRELPMQMQSVLFLAGRGPDGVEKNHPCKHVIRAYRAFVFNAAKYGRQLTLGDQGDTFMTLEYFESHEMWNVALRDFFRTHDQLPHHYLKHFIHGVEILGYYYPELGVRQRWQRFYLQMVEELHMQPETKEMLDARLADWNRKDWDEQ